MSFSGKDQELQHAATEQTPAIEVIDLIKDFGGRRAVDNISFEIPRGGRSAVCSVPTAPSPSERVLHWRAAVLDSACAGRHLGVAGVSAGCVWVQHPWAGILLVPAFVVLVGMGWVLGWLIRAAVLRYGTSSEVLAWSLAFLFQPISAVFYPVSTLPPWLQKADAPTVRLREL
ncbi:MAG: hypothetical protein H0T12_08000 [Actinobacteria bacterium]|nr:hypothetical protein [Actinomycetota bacterium]